MINPRHDTQWDIFNEIFKINILKSKTYCMHATEIVGNKREEKIITAKSGNKK